MSPRVAVIGTGFSGIAAGVALKRAGVQDITIFEMNAGIGGTWWDNRYPGAMVDLESHIYSFSYARSDWSAVYASWDEVQRYLDRVVDDHDLRRHVAFNEKVESVTWIEADQAYQVQTSSGMSWAPFTAVVSAVGVLNIPAIPPFARGETEFGGALCHTSHWIEDLDMTGKRVAVLGTGSSAVQIVVEAAAVASDLTIFQIEPNWIVPKGVHTYTPAERRRLRKRFFYWLERTRLFLRYERRFFNAAHARHDGWSHKQRRKMAADYLNDSLRSDPELLALATPAFAFEGRRTVLSDDYYQALLAPNVHLVPHAMTKLTGDGAVDASGNEYDFDVIVMATGFQAANFLANFTVTGPAGVEIHEQWAGEPEAFLGMAVPGFPNFFMMFGPNTVSVPLPAFFEIQANFIAKVVAHLGSNGRHQAEVSERANRRYNDRLQKMLRKTVWAEVESYFRAEEGRIVTQWPYNCTQYRIAATLGRRFAMKYR
jgi:cation diffusion facilitator CzcD-associated flavoprotein CzcO